MKVGLDDLLGWVTVAREMMVRVEQEIGDVGLTSIQRATLHRDLEELNADVRRLLTETEPF